MGFLTTPSAQYAPMGLSNPAPLETPHIADQAANIVGQYITDHGNMLRQRLLMGQSSGNLAPPKYQAPNIASQMRSTPARTISPQWSNLGSLASRIQPGAQGRLPKLVQQYEGGR